MKNRGFTLVELLAVIAILSIVALITIPIVSKYVNDSKIDARVSSVQLYGREIENQIKVYMAGHNGKVPTGTYYSTLDTKGKILYDSTGQELTDFDISFENGKIACDTIIINPDGSVYITDCMVTEDKYIKEKDNTENYEYGTLKKKCSVVSGTGTAVGDEIACESEHFYVVSNDGINIQMLAKYNLDVGQYAYAGGTGLQNEMNAGYKWDENNKYKTGETNTQGQDIYYGSVPFVTSKYWTETESFVYNENSNIWQYVNGPGGYEYKLKEMGVTSASATLLSKEQTEELGVSEAKGYQYPDFLFSTSYWLGTSSSSKIYCAVSVKTVNPASYTEDYQYGVRPLVTISANEI